MLGVLDSGEGGENAVKELRLLAPRSDLVLFKDKKNSPYGRKSRDELKDIVSVGIERLIKEGCDRVLIACCTASTVHSELPHRPKELSTPIILPTATRARELSRAGKIALIATDATVRSHAFADYLGDELVGELAASHLVDEIERGARDGLISRQLCEYLCSLMLEVAGTGADTLILGCTHFVRLSGEITRIYKSITGRKITLVDSAKEGAGAILREHPQLARGDGRLLRIE